jgi:2'-5' RNA ligase
MKRIFIGFKVANSDGKQLISDMQHSNNSLIDGIKWTLLGNFHVTSHFIGELEAEKIEVLSAAIKEIGKNLQSTTISIDKIGCFPHFKSRIIAAYVASNPILTTAYEALSTALEIAGVTAELRDYKPHITLARGLKKNAELTDITSNYSCLLKQFILYESAPQEGGSRYIPLTTVELD